MLYKINKNVMKRISQFILAILMISFTSCNTESVGPAGPPGAQGPDGPAGADGESAILFEYSDVDFIGPNYNVILDYPVDFEGLDSDVTLVYFLWEVDDSGLEIWRQLPQTIYTIDGFLNYNFDFSKVDVKLYLTFDFDKSLLIPADTDDWIVRTVIIPGDFWGGRISVDHSDYYAVKEAYGLPDMPMHIAAKRRE
jgi:hypothetical protein